MACPKCGCKVAYQYDGWDDCGMADDRLERCAACGEVFDIEEHVDEEEEALAGWVEAGLVCQACAGDAPRGKCMNARCIGGPIVRELVPAGGLAPTHGGQHG